MSEQIVSYQDLLVAYLQKHGVNCRAGFKSSKPLYSLVYIRKANDGVLEVYLYPEIIALNMDSFEVDFGKLFPKILKAVSSGVWLALHFDIRYDGLWTHTCEPKESVGK